jgi:hypothetical protein
MHSDEGKTCDNGVVGKGPRARRVLSFELERRCGAPRHTPGGLTPARGCASRRCAASLFDPVLLAWVKAKEAAFERSGRPRPSWCPPSPVLFLPQRPYLPNAGGIQLWAKPKLGPGSHSPEKNEEACRKFAHARLPAPLGGAPSSPLVSKATVLTPAAQSYRSSLFDPLRQHTI